VRCAAGQRHRHRARLREVLRLHHLPRRHPRRLRDAERSDRQEEDLLDKAWGLEATSRLSCQVVLGEDDLTVEIPKYTINHASENH
jgi:hypothetical protein